MASLDSFLSRLIPQVIGCPDITATQALLDACIEFCDESLLIQTTSAPQSVTANVGSYTLTVPSETAVASVIKVWYGAKQLAPANAADIDSILAYVATAGTDTVQTGVPNTYYELTPGVIGVYPVPQVSVSNILSARVATKPTRAAVNVSDILYNDWAEVLVAGAVSRLASLQGQVYTNVPQATASYTQYWNGISKATALRVRGRQISSLAVRSRAFA